jgi:predicted nucleic acid-binding protein
MSADLTFVDTNVLVYAHDLDSDQRKHDEARAALEDLWTAGTGALSTQVLQEFYVTVTRKLARPLARPDAREVVATYTAWPVQRIDAEDVLAASELEDEHALSFWDALILVAASRSGATRVLTEDLQPGQEIRGVRIETPFA